MNFIRMYHGRNKTIHKMYDTELNILRIELIWRLDTICLFNVLMSNECNNGNNDIHNNENRVVDVK